MMEKLREIFDRIMSGDLKKCKCDAKPGTECPVHNPTGVVNPYNCDKASANQCLSYPNCGCEWFL